MIASGRNPEPLTRILAGQTVGTLFLSHGNGVPSRERWLGYTARPRGWLKVDDGARQAIEKHGKSLLPIGVVAVEGVFGKGDVVAICNRDGCT